jgi:hypothetical protein
MDLPFSLHQTRDRVVIDVDPSQGVHETGSTIDTLFARISRDG